MSFICINHSLVHNILVFIFVSFLQANWSSLYYNGKHQAPLLFPSRFHDVSLQVQLCFTRIIKVISSWFICIKQHRVSQYVCFCQGQANSTGCTRLDYFHSFTVCHHPSLQVPRASSRIIKDSRFVVCVQYICDTWAVQHPTVNIRVIVSWTPQL